MQFWAILAEKVVKCLGYHLGCIGIKLRGSKHAQWQCLVGTGLSLLVQVMGKL